MQVHCCGAGQGILVVKGEYDAFLWVGITCGV
jgi:hypothetical protein